MLELNFEDEVVETINKQSDIYGEIIEDEIYHNMDGVGSTMLSILVDNALKYKMIKDGLYKMQSVAFENGSILHEKILEKDKENKCYLVSEKEITRVAKKVFKDDLDYVIVPDEFLTPSGSISKKKDTFDEYLEWKEENNENIVINKKDLECVEFLEAHKNIILIDKERDENLNIALMNAHTLPKFKHYIENGYPERCFSALIDGVLCRAKPDLIFVPDENKPNEIIVFDFKSTAKESTSKEWLKSSANFGYAQQQVHYTRVLEECGFEVLDFYFAYASLLVYGGATYQSHTVEDIDFAKTQHTKALHKLKWCIENDTFSVADFNGNGFEVLNRQPLPVFTQFKSVY